MRPGARAGTHAVFLCTTLLAVPFTVCAGVVMTNEEWIDMLRVIAPEQQNELVLVLKNMSEISVDTFFRFEPTFLVLRGRVAGTTEEGRAFFVPYDQMVYMRVERVVNLHELETIFESLPKRTVAKVTEPPASIPVAEPPAPVPAVGPAPAAAPDPVNSHNALLDRIRAARATQQGNRHMSR